MKCAEFLRASTVETALKLMERHAGHALVVAGGTDLMLKARGRNWYERKVIVDISGIEALKSIERKGNTLIIGALATLADISESEEVIKYMPLLAQACASVGSPQIRNKGTLGGNVVNACPAADCVPALMVLDTVVIAAKGSGSREIPIKDFFKPCKACMNHGEMSVRTCYYADAAQRKTLLEPGEIVVAFQLPIPPETSRGSFQKVGRLEALSMSKFNLAVLLDQDEEKRLRLFRLSMGAVFPKPMVFEELDDMLLGRYPCEQEIRAYVELIARKIRELCGESVRTDYKYMVCKGLCERTLLQLIRGKTDGY